MSFLVVRVEGASEELVASFSFSFAEAVTLRSSSPSGEGEFGPGGAAYAFTVSQAPEPLVLSFEYLPERLGRTDGHLTLSSGNESLRLPLEHFVFP